MQNPSDKELDDLFKAAAEQSEGDAALPEWLDMTKRLDEAKRADATLFIRGVVTGSVLLLVISILVWIEVSTKNTTLSNENSAINIIDSDPISSLDNSADPQPQKSTKNNEASISAQSTVEKSRLKISNAEWHVANLMPENVQSSSSLVISNEPSNEGLSIQATSSDRNQLGVLVDHYEISDSALVEVAINEDLKEAMEASREEKPEQVNLNQRGLSIKLAISPDYSTVESSKPGGVGLNYGALLEYHFNNKISVATGVIRAKKIYSAVDVEYNGYTSDRVSGDCRMWDIPITIYYYFYSGRVGLLYAGIGVSSYLMSKEDYIYYVDGPYNTYTYYQSVRGKNNEWFSVANLSVGFEKRLNERFAFQLEPFYKAPLAGVGEGDVSLASFGAFFNIKYNFLKQEGK